MGAPAVDRAEYRRMKRNWRTARKHARRNHEKHVLRRIHIKINRGALMRLDCGEHGVILVPANGLEQPRAYRVYP